MAPSHASALARAQAKRLTGGVQARAIEPRNYWIRGADAVECAEGNIGGQRQTRAVRGPRAGGGPWHARKLHAGRPRHTESGGVGGGRGAGQEEKGEGSALRTRSRHKLASGARPCASSRQT